MLREYLPVLLQVIVAMLFAGSALLVSILVGKSGKRTRAKDTAYECGMVPQGQVQPRFSVKFYLVAMLFILFDVEAVFLYPWAIILKDLKAHGQALFGISEMFVYLGIVLVGFWYIWKKGALDWGLTISSPQAARMLRSTRNSAPPAEQKTELVGAAGRGDR